MFFMEQYFEWDEAKNRKNQKKHDVSFETASLVFEDPLRISIQDRHTDDEECLICNSMYNRMRIIIKRIRKSMIPLSKQQVLFLKNHEGHQCRKKMTVKNVGKPLEK